MWELKRFILSEKNSSKIKLEDILIKLFDGRQSIVLHRIIVI